MRKNRILTPSFFQFDALATQKKLSSESSPSKFRLKHFDKNMWKFALSLDFLDNDHEKKLR